MVCASYSVSLSFSATWAGLASGAASSTTEGVDESVEPWDIVDGITVAREYRLDLWPRYPARNV